MRALISRLLRFFVTVLRYVQRALLRMDAKLGAGFQEAAHMDKVRQSAERHDMVTAPDEPYYALQYARAIMATLEATDTPKDGAYLDLGCGQGRLTTVLKDWAHSDAARIVGVDLSATAIGQAKAYAKAGGHSGIQYQEGEVLEYLRGLPDASLDCVLATEVLYFVPDPKAVMAEIVRALKPGGLFMSSLRSQYYYALLVVADGLWDSTEMVLNDREGRLLQNDVWLSWTRAAEVADQFQNGYGLKITSMEGIGVCSGLPGDPHAHIARPSNLSKDEQERLSALERSIGKDIPDAGRYIFVGAKKVS